MDSVLEKLGIRDEVRLFFSDACSVSDHGLQFFYGNEVEFFNLNGHKVPLTKNIWCAGAANLHAINRIFICCSAMEAIAFLQLHCGLFRQLDGLLFVSFGRRPDLIQLQSFIRLAGKRKYALITGNGILGAVCDIKIACWLRKKEVSIAHSPLNGVIEVKYRDRTYSFKEEHFSLNAFELATGFRSRIRTYKSTIHNSFIEQLKENASF